jgi:hypothetical protein
VKAVVSGYDLVLIIAPLADPVAPRELECGLIGLCTRVREEDAIGKGNLRQLMRESNRGLIRKDVRDVPEPLGLLGECVDKDRVTMPQRVDCNATGEVDVLGSVLIPEPRPFAIHGHDGGWGIVGNHDVLVQVPRY